jgi:hypothetical protein
MMAHGMVAASNNGPDATVKFDLRKYINSSFTNGSIPSEEIFVSETELEALNKQLEGNIFSLLSLPVAKEVPVRDVLQESRPQSQQRHWDSNLPPRSRPLQEDGPPGFEDEYEMNRGPRGPFNDNRNVPIPYGDRDLNPPGLGPFPPLQPSIGGYGEGIIGGMHPTIDDPLFRRNLRDPDSRGPDSRGPDLSRPPGARWDPTGPGFGSGGVGGFGPNRYI